MHRRPARGRAAGFDPGMPQLPPAVWSRSGRAAGRISADADGGHQHSGLPLCVPLSPQSDAAAGCKGKAGTGVVGAVGGWSTLFGGG